MSYRKCKIIYNKKNPQVIESVLDHNGNDSVLFREALIAFNNDQELALNAWATAHTEAFKEIFALVQDSYFNTDSVNNLLYDNGEPKLKYVLNYIRGEESTSPIISEELYVNLIQRLKVSQFEDLASFVASIKESLYNNNGIFSLTRQSLSKVGLFGKAEIEYILKNKTAQETLKEDLESLIASFDNKLIENIDLSAGNLKENATFIIERLNTEKESSKLFEVDSLFSEFIEETVDTLDVEEFEDVLQSSVELQPLAEAYFKAPTFPKNDFLSFTIIQNEWESNSFRVRIGNSTLYFKWQIDSETNAPSGDLVISLLETDAPWRGLGEASKALKDFLKYTDSIKTKVWLKASPIEDELEIGLEQDQLVEFYERNGFESTSYDRNILYREVGGLKEAKETSTRDGIKFMVVGEQGARNSAELYRQLNKAKYKFAKGELLEDIVKETGWYRARDGWKLLSMDLLESFKTLTFEENKLLTLKDILGEENPLFASYSTLSSQKVVFVNEEKGNVPIVLSPTFKGSNGYYDAENKTIIVRSFNTKVGKPVGELEKSMVLAHEVNHIIQLIEGFSTGGGSQSIFNEAILISGKSTKKTYSLEEFKDLLSNIKTDSLSNNELFILEEASATLGALFQGDAATLRKKYQHILAEIDSNVVSAVLKLQETGKPVNLNYLEAIQAFTSVNNINLDRIFLLRNGNIRFQVSQVNKVASRVSSQTITQVTKGDFTKVAAKLKKAFPNVKLNIVSEVNQADTTISSLLRTSNGIVYGFVKDGEVFINENTLNFNTLLHEYGHIFSSILKLANNSTYNSLIEKILEEKALIALKRENEYYSELSDEEIADEVLAELIGNKGAQLLSEDKPIHREILSLIEQLWKTIKSVFSADSINIADWSLEEFKNATLQDIVDDVTANILAGRITSRISSAQLKDSNIDSVQYQIIQEESDSNKLPPQVVEALVEKIKEGGLVSNINLQSENDFMEGLNTILLSRPDEVSFSEQQDSEEIKKQLTENDNKSKRWVHPSERQLESDKPIIVDEGETSPEGFGLLKGEGKTTGGKVVYQGTTYDVVKETASDVTININNEDVTLDKSKVFTAVPSSGEEVGTWFDLEALPIDLENLNILELYDEVYNQGRLLNKEFSDEEVYGISAFVIETAIEKAGNLSTLVSDAVALYTKHEAESPVSTTFNKTADGNEITTPNRTYNEAVSNNHVDRGENLWIRDAQGEVNDKRVLLVQFSSTFLYGKNRFKRDKNSTYFDSLYRTVKGYDRTADFWEVPLWMARLSGLEKNADVYVIRNIEEATEFFKSAGYGKILFSALDVNEKYINSLATELPNQAFQIGGYVNFKSLEDKSNVKTFDTVEQYAEFNNLKDEYQYSYRHFRGTAIIPRLKMSEGCTYKCAFCSIPKTVISMPVDIIDSQIKEINDLDATLVYLDDKTFGQAKNYTYLAEVYNKLKEGNPNFEGFIIQTTAVDFANKKKFSKEFLEKSHIKYVELGVETYNDDILLKLNKKHSYKKFVDNSLENARENNVKVIANIIVGLSGKNKDGSYWSETEETYDNTLQFLKDNKDIISHLNVYSLALYEGTPLGDAIEAKEEADKNENIVSKSFHTNPQLHEDAMEMFSSFGIELLKNVSSRKVIPTTLRGIVERYVDLIDILKKERGAHNVSKVIDQNGMVWYSSPLTLEDREKPVIVFSKGLQEETQPIFNTEKAGLPFIQTNTSLYSIVAGFDTVRNVVVDIDNKTVTDITNKDVFEEYLIVQDDNVNSGLVKSITDIMMIPDYIWDVDYQLVQDYVELVEEKAIAFGIDIVGLSNEPKQKVLNTLIKLAKVITTNYSTEAVTALQEEISNNEPTYTIKELGKATQFKGQNLVTIANQHKIVEYDLFNKLDLLKVSDTNNIFLGIDKESSIQSINALYLEVSNKIGYNRPLDEFRAEVQKEVEELVELSEASDPSQESMERFILFKKYYGLSTTNKARSNTNLETSARVFKSIFDGIESYDERDKYLTFLKTDFKLDLYQDYLRAKMDSIYRTAQDTEFSLYDNFYKYLDFNNLNKVTIKEHIDDFTLDKLRTILNETSLIKNSQDILNYFKMTNDSKVLYKKEDIDKVEIDNASDIEVVLKDNLTLLPQSKNLEVKRLNEDYITTTHNEGLNFININNRLYSKVASNVFNEFGKVDIFVESGSPLARSGFVSTLIKKRGLNNRKGILPYNRIATISKKVSEDLDSQLICN